MARCELIPAHYIRTQTLVQTKETKRLGVYRNNDRGWIANRVQWKAEIGRAESRGMESNEFKSRPDEEGFIHHAYRTCMFIARELWLEQMTEREYISLAHALV